ncbi:MAG: DUF4097 family beta strand repeat protein [Kangiellaceae bacterium]|nr:DUF4097 family beta strand repeat protein [Kangiellaceae bacterium]
MTQMIQTMKLGALATLLAAATFAADATEKKRFSETYEFNRDGNVAIENINGDITITGWDRDEISLEYTVTADSKKDLERVKVEVNHSKSSFDVEVDINSKKGWFGWGGSSGEVEFELKVPNSVSLKTIESVNGDLALEGISGDVKADTVNGRIKISGSKGDVTADTVNGDIEIRMQRMSDGQRIKGDSVNGDIEVYAPEDSSFSLRTETVNGDLSNDFGIEIDEGKYVGADMDGEYNGGGAKLVFDTVNGDIDLKKD